mgnify:CR=1 FL=1
MVIFFLEADEVIKYEIEGGTQKITKRVKFDSLIALFLPYGFRGKASQQGHDAVLYAAESAFMSDTSVHDDGKNEELSAGRFHIA